MIFKRKFFYPSLFLLLLIFVTAISFNGLYGQDAYEYFRYTKALHNFFLTGEKPYDFFWSYMYPFVASLFSFVFSAEFSLQLVSILAFVGTIYFTEKIILLLNTESKITTRIYLLLFLFLSPFSLRMAVTDMSDVLCPIPCCYHC